MTNIDGLNDIIGQFSKKICFSLCRLLMSPFFTRDRQTEVSVLFERVDLGRDIGL